jgi:hypothetical protein
MTLDQAQELNRDFSDHAVFCRESLSIRDLGGSRVPLELSPGQVKLNAAIERQRRAGKPVRLAILKARRTYFTVGSCAEMFHQVPFFAGRRGLVIADKYKPAALEAFDYLLQFQRHYRPFDRPGTKIFLPELVKDTEQKLKWANQSTLRKYLSRGREAASMDAHERNLIANIMKRTEGSTPEAVPRARLRRIGSGQSGF